MIENDNIELRLQNQENDDECFIEDEEDQDKIQEIFNKSRLVYDMDASGYYVHKPNFAL